ncbi:TetR/AcrR family transcriptional regulator [Staphylococcus shinii]|jgi:AcrR family transcriptional regulator|uniref:TetR/AcrR family transcriptional regulator C-terminal domain-containing protein n=1 Tax=Staphylococcus TaxID=1279 RepID=UPI00057BE947|nr:TetR/AcrR family transcriptional regulator C-terminal domain-containing protein [Staphylococcus shinii]MBO3065535.1 TetR/AcrR family transcriptional regulator C-terminal domain-containing protein [Staphylococcus shinii]MEC5300863.1 TetR/AcrR family transcriptional regulator [Staphylococcus shinii]OEK89977.1 TetR family transcriptional regulator [Staphylococcus shinii]PKI10162.1 TetR family transcriptional regulator [Staphylococcus shinii]PKI15137.1 TetR family transcriptional regulator [Sta
MVEDRRVRKTKNAIKQAFIKLLAEKELERITIQDITTLADINRGTFYLHYEDKYILLSDLEDEFIDDLAEEIGTFKLVLQGSNLEDFAKIFSEKILKNIILHIQKDIDFYLLIFKLDRKSHLEDKISELIYVNMAKNINNKTKISGIPLDYFHSYVSGATISFIKHWVQDKNRMDPDVVVDYLFKIIFNGPLRLMANEQYQ